MSWEDEDWNPDEDFLANQEVYPWQRGNHGKFYINPGGDFVHWQTNEMGEPHHDVAAGKFNDQQAVKGDIAPNGAWWVTDDYSGGNGDDLVQQAAPQAQGAGLSPTLRGYVAKHTETCDNCGLDYRACRCEPETTWFEDPASDSLRDVKPEYGGNSGE